MIALKNSSEPVEERVGQQYYRWQVFLDAPQDVLDNVEEVHYLLHPTFPEPERTVRDRSSSFALESAGWGEFTIVADVKFRDGRTEKLTHWLSLGQERPAAK